VEQPIEHRFAQANGIRIHYVEAGSGPAVLLLHGFPDCWYGWRYQIDALAAAGFRVVAPDLRGYNATDAPRGTGAYALETLVNDLILLIGALGLEAATVVGHDWGGVIGWFAAMHHPVRISRLAVLNAPHPVTFARELRRPAQLIRSAYAGFFQIPALPETLLRARRSAILRRAWRNGPARDEEDVQRYMEAFQRPYALTAALNYYRASARHPVPKPRRVRIPTLVLWGERDHFLVTRLLDGLDPWVENLRVHRMKRAAHWLHHEQPDLVNELLISFLTGSPDEHGPV
jgi:epoxide hydrolase 4